MSGDAEGRIIMLVPN